MLRNNRSESVRVLHVTAVGETAALLVAPLARDQVARGYSVEFACAPSPVTRVLRNEGMLVHPVPFSRKLLDWRHLLAFVSLVRLMRSRSYDVVHAHTPIAALLARFAAYTASVPVVIYHLRGTFWDSPSRLVRALYTAAEWLAGRMTTHVFSINCLDREEVVRRGIVRADRVTCLHAGGAGLDVEKFSPDAVSPGETARLRRQLAIESGDFVVGFIGRMVRAKGVLDLVAAFERVVAVHPHARLLLVGSTLDSDRDAGLEEEIRRQVARAKLTKRIVFAGFRNEIAGLLSLMDVVVLPSYREGFGMVIAEAMAMSRPVIATATRGAREIVADGITGLLVPVGDRDALAAAIERLCSDPRLRHQLRRAGRSSVVEHHGMARVTAEIEDVYARLLAEQPLGRSVPKPAVA